MSEPRESTHFWTQKRLVVVMTGVLVFVLIALGLTFNQNYHLGLDQEQLRENNLVNRVAICKVQIALEIPLGNECATPEMLRRYNPEEEIRRGGNFRSDLIVLLCTMAEKEGSEFPQVCEG